MLDSSARLCTVVSEGSHFTVGAAFLKLGALITILNLDQHAFERCDTARARVHLVTFWDTWDTRYDVWDTWDTRMGHLGHSKLRMGHLGHSRGTLGTLQITYGTLGTLTWDTI